MNALLGQDALKLPDSSSGDIVRINNISDGKNLRDILQSMGVRR